MALYIGVPGSLVAFPNLQKGYQRPVSRLGGFHTLADGSTVFDLIGHRQTFTLSGQGLTNAELGDLDRLIYTRGPLAVIDPAQVNLLTPNQSTGTDERQDARGFSSSAGTVASSTAQAWEGSRSAAWTCPAGMPAFNVFRASDGLPFDANNPLFGVPAVEGQVYTFSVYLRLSAGTEVFYPKIDWYDDDGTLISGQDPPDPAGSTVTTTWARYTVTGAAPAGTAYAQPILLNFNTIATDVTLHTDGLQLEHAPAASPWVVGRGVPLCSITTELDASVPIIGRHHVALTLRQAVAY